MEQGYSIWQLLCLPQSNGERDCFKITSATFLSPSKHHHKCKGNSYPSATRLLLTAHTAWLGARVATSCLECPRHRAQLPSLGRHGLDLGRSLTSQYYEADEQCVKNACFCSSIHLREAICFKVSSLACPSSPLCSFSTLSFPRAEDKSKLSVITMTSSETAGLHPTYLNSQKQPIFAPPPTPGKLWSLSPLWPHLQAWCGGRVSFIFSWPYIQGVTV